MYINDQVYTWRRYLKNKIRIMTSINIIIYKRIITYLDAYLPGIAEVIPVAPFQICRRLKKTSPLTHLINISNEKTRTKLGT